MCWQSEKVSEQRGLTAPCTARPDRDPEIYHFFEQKEYMVVSEYKSRPQCSFIVMPGCILKCEPG